MLRKQPDWPYDCSPITNGNRRGCPEYRCCALGVAAGEVPLCEWSDAKVGIPPYQEKADYYGLRTEADLRDIEIDFVETHSVSMPHGTLHIEIKEFA